MWKNLKSAVYGLAIGDALGVPVEFKRRGSFRVHGMEGYGTHNQPPGTWSDDTSMTIATCSSIKRCGKIDLKDIMKCFRAWLYKGEFTPHGEVFDCGNTTAAAIRQGYGLTDEFSNGNGSLMRILPLAFLPGVTDEEIAAVSGLTHAHELSKEACILYVKIAKELIAGKPIMEAVRLHVQPGSKFEKLISINTLAARDIKSSGYVVDTLEAAIWAVATTSSFASCIMAAVLLGDDTDTVGAVAGGLAGIIYGMDGIPETWLDMLQNKALIDDCIFPIPGTHEFAVKWRNMYKNHSETPGYYFEDAAYIGDGMRELGFEMDCGRSIEKMFPSSGAFNDNAALQRIIERIDFQTLGNAIFSQWRWWNHWSMSPMSEKDYEWFVIAFSRLAELTE